MRIPLVLGLLIAASAAACDDTTPASERAPAREPVDIAEAPADSDAGHAADSVAVVAAVDAFHAALASADTAAVRRLMADDVVVLESGGVETRAEYFDHHLAADMAFSAAVPGTREVRRVEVRGDVAWLVATSRRSGTFRDREIDSVGAELVVLERRPGGWRISAVHWSSRSGN